MDFSKFEYIGWVPCVSGHLDFGLMQVGLHGSFIPTSKYPLIDYFNRRKDPTRDSINFATTGETDSHHRRIMLQSWVDWRDDTVGDGKTQVVVTAEVNKNDSLDERSLTGHILIFQRKYKTEYREACDHLMSTIGNIARSLKKFKNLPQFRRFSSWNETQARLNGLWEQLDSTISSSQPIAIEGDEKGHIYCLNFHITNKGFLYLKYVPNKYDETKPITDDTKYTLARQAFYYLKYSIHIHKHHIDRIDALTTIIPWSTDSTSKSNASLKMIGQLKRELTTIKRSQSSNKRVCDDSALGITGYLKSLVNSLKCDDMITVEIYNREIKHIEGMQISFEAQHEKINSIRQERDSSLSTERQWMTIVIALVSLTYITWIKLNGVEVASPKTTSDIPMLLRLYTWGEHSLISALALQVIFLLTLIKTIKFFTGRQRPYGRYLRMVARSSWGSVILLFSFIFVVLGFTYKELFIF